MGVFNPIWTVIGIMIFIVLLVKFWEIWLWILLGLIGLWIIGWIIWKWIEFKENSDSENDRP